MRKPILLLASTALAGLLACGVALAGPGGVTHCSDNVVTEEGWCLGGPGPDTIYGTNGEDLIQGLGGDDTMYGARMGDLLLDTTEGRNVAFGNRGDDSIFIRGKASGGAGDDTIRLKSWGPARGGKGDDQIRVRNERRNRVFCGPGQDWVRYDRELDTIADGCEERTTLPPLI